MIIIFDLDGTILNTFRAIRLNLIDLFTKKQIPYDEDLIKSFFGPPLIDSFMKITNDVEKANYLADEYRATVAKNKYQVSLFPDTLAVLAKLSKFNHLAILSNKVHRFVYQGLVECGIEKYFEEILGLDDVLVPKPDPKGIYMIKSKYPEEKCIYVGDTTTDILTAKNALVTSVGVTYALTTKEELLAVGADYTIDSLKELIRIVEEINV